MKLTKFALIALTTLAVAFAQEAPKKKAAAGPLMPAMTPVGDPTYKKPMGTMGTKGGCTARWVGSGHTSMEVHLGHPHNEVVASEKHELCAPSPDNLPWSCQGAR